MTEQKLITEYDAIFKTYTEFENFVKQFNEHFLIEDYYNDNGKIYASYFDIKEKSVHDAFIETDFYKVNKDKLYISFMTMDEINYKDNPTKIVNYTIGVKQDDSFLNGQQGILKQRTKTLYDAKFETFTESLKLSAFNGYDLNGKKIKRDFAYSQTYRNLKIKLVG